MFQGYLKKVQREFQGFFKCVSRGFQGSFKGVTRKILGCYREVSRKDVARKFQWSFWKIEGCFNGVLNGFKAV